MFFGFGKKRIHESFGGTSIDELYFFKLLGIPGSCLTAQGIYYLTAIKRNFGHREPTSTVD